MSQEPIGGASFTPKSIKWGTCDDAFMRLFDVRCGFVEVPLDYRYPKGSKIQLAVSRLKHTVKKSKYQGVMLTNPGGPGSSGLQTALLQTIVAKKAGYAYDWIGFDPRGVGASRPALSCDARYDAPPRPAFVPSTQALETTWLNRTKNYAAACGKAGGELLKHVRTIDTVNDMESIRKALGVSKINFFGSSYGSYLGQVYATLHPHRVRRMVLDGIVDPRSVWYKGNLDQNKAFAKNLDVYFAWVARHDRVFHLGKTPKKVKRLYSSARSKLAKKPAGRMVGAAEWDDIFIQAAYDVESWPASTRAFAGYTRKGAWKPLKKLYDDSHPSGAGADNEFAMYLATQCSDVRWPKDWYRWRMDSWVSHGRAPLTTWSNTWFNAPCLNWPVQPGTPVVVNGAKAPKMLLVSETYDGATPFQGALEVRARFPKSVLIEGVGGTSHASAVTGGSACVNNAVADYLSKGTTPTRLAGRKADRRCSPNPQPKPTDN